MISQPPTPSIFINSWNTRVTELNKELENWTKEKRKENKGGPFTCTPDLRSRFLRLFDHLEAFLLQLTGLKLTEKKLLEYSLKIWSPTGLVFTGMRRWHGIAQKQFMNLSNAKKGKYPGGLKAWGERPLWFQVKVSEILERWQWLPEEGVWHILHEDDEEPDEQD